jgi:hypothetical protein
MAVIFQDNFTDTDGVYITAHTPDTDVPGNGWVDYATADKAEIRSNELRITGNGEGCLVDVEDPDITITADYTPATGKLNKYRVIFRSDGANNEWMMLADEQANNLVLYKDGGSQDSASVTFNEGTTYELKVVASGSSIKGYVDNTEYVSVTDATHSDHTQVGFYRTGSTTPSSGGVFDNFTVEDETAAGAAVPVLMYQYRQRRS